MAKQTGLGDAFFVGSSDLSGDIGAIQSIATPRAVIDVSPINVSGYARLLGRADGSMAFTGFFNPTGAHVTLSAVGTASGTATTVASYVHGAAVGNDVACLSAQVHTYETAVGADGAIAVTSAVHGATGAPVEWGLTLTAQAETYASAGSATSYIDGAASSAFGAAAYLHAFSLSSGTATVTVQDSANATSWADVSGLSWSVTGGTASRLATSATATIRRYRRVNVTGTFTNLNFCVGLVVYPTSQT